MAENYTYKSGNKVFLHMTVEGGKIFGIATDRLVKNVIAGTLKNKVFANPYKTMLAINAALDKFKTTLEKKDRDMEDYKVTLKYDFPGVKIDEKELTKVVSALEKVMDEHENDEEVKKAGEEQAKNA